MLLQEQNSRAGQRKERVKGGMFGGAHYAYKRK
jgi:hypothetical protein